MKQATSAFYALIEKWRGYASTQRHPDENDFITVGEAQAFACCADELEKEVRQVKSTWQPIEYANKDGRPLLVFNEKWWAPIQIAGWDAHELAWRVHCSGCPAEQPTHFVECPDHPDA
jgi:hypothetical protein